MHERNDPHARYARQRAHSVTAQFCKCVFIDEHQIQGERVRVGVVELNKGRPFLVKLKPKFMRKGKQLRRAAAPGPQRSLLDSTTTKTKPLISPNLIPLTRTRSLIVIDSFLTSTT